MRQTYIVVHGIRIAKDFVPETFGRLTTIGPVFLVPLGNKTASTRKNRKKAQVCQCSCGNVKLINVSTMRLGMSLSCGCLHSGDKYANRKTHGKTKTSEHKIWVNMNHRCYNENHKQYASYGGRGIYVCPSWRRASEQTPGGAFSQFLTDVGNRPSPKHSIDRIDNDGPYAPGNVRWATKKEQADNRRNSVKYTAFGKTQSLVDWAKELGTDATTLSGRLNRGWEIEKALSTHPRHLTRNKK